MAEIDEVRAMNNEDLHEELDSSQFALMNLRFRASTLPVSYTHLTLPTKA